MEIRLRCPVRFGLVVLAFGACALPGLLRAESPAEKAPVGHYVFKDYGRSMGLGNLGIDLLAQDRAGFIWVGTDDGLYRYDGYRFDAFGLREGLPSTEVEALHVDAAGTLWVGTRTGLGRWNGTSFEQVVFASVPQTPIVDDLADGPDGIWATTNFGLFVGQGTRFERKNDWPGGEATAVLRDAHSARMWVGQFEGDACILAYQDGGWRRFNAPPGHPKERVDDIVEDGQGRIWARTARSLWMLQAGGSQFSEVATPFPLNAQRGYLATDSRGNLWVSTDHGLYRSDGASWIDYGIPEGNRPLLEDREGSIWFGIMGVRRLLGGGVFHAYNGREGLPGIVVWSVFRDREQRLWVGTDAGLAVAKGERFDPIPGTEGNLIRSIVEASDGALYLTGIPGNDVLRYDPATKSVTRSEIWPNNPIKRTFRLFLDSTGAFWAATEGAGLFRAEPSRGEGLRFSPVALPDGTPQEDILDIREDGDGRIWIAGQHGLAMLDHGAWRRFHVGDGLRRDQLAYLRTTHDGDLLVAYRDPIGIDRIRYRAGGIEVRAHYDTASSQSADKVFMVGEDARHRIWVGGGSGVDLLSPGAATRHFGADDGLIGEDISNQAFLADPNGDVWVGTAKGLARFDAAAFDAIAPAKRPAVTFMRMRLGSVDVPVEADDPAVAHGDNTFQAHFSALSYAGEGKVQYRQRLIGRETDSNITDLRDVRYSALEPGAYRFEVAARVGDLGEWGPTAAFSFRVLPAWWQTWWFRILEALAAIAVLMLAVRLRMATLRQRNAWLEGEVARRTLEVRQSNDRLSDTNAKLHAEIDIRTAAERAVSQRNEELQALNRKLAGTQSQLLQSEKMASVGQLAAGVAHEINNPIGFVGSNLRQLQSYADELFALLDAYEDIERSAASDAATARLQGVKAHVDIAYLRDDTPNLLAESLSGISRVEKIVKDLREFAHPGEPKWQKVDVQKSLESTLNVAAPQIRAKAEIVTDYADLPLIDGVPSQLNQVFLNLLINAAQAIENHGTITVRTRCEGDEILVSIADTGCGIDPAILHRIFDPFFTTKPIGVGPGLGLSVSYGIVKEHGGTIDVETEAGRGAIFTVRLPIRRRTQTTGNPHPAPSTPDS